VFHVALLNVSQEKQQELDSRRKSSEGAAVTSTTVHRLNASMVRPPSKGKLLEHMVRYAAASYALILQEARPSAFTSGALAVLRPSFTSSDVLQARQPIARPTPSTVDEEVPRKKIKTKVSRHSFTP